MKHVGRLIIALGLPAIVIVAFALATNRGATPPDRSQILLDTYLNRLSATGQSAGVIQIAPASQPFRFSREMSDYSLGYGVYYATTDVVQRSQPAAIRAPDPLATLHPRNANTPAVTYYPAGSDGGGRALRYPPDYASCVLIEQGAKFAVVVLAEHHDLWNADWVLHTSTLSPQKLIETLGCDLNLPQ
jgi:hypothetical protein